MGANSKYIPLTVRLENSTYHEFHALVAQHGATHVGIIRILIRRWISEKRAHTKDRDAKRMA